MGSAVCLKILIVYKDKICVGGAQWIDVVFAVCRGIHIFGDLLRLWRRVWAYGDVHWVLLEFSVICNVGLKCG